MIKGLRYIIKCKCLLFRGHQWFYRAFIFCYFSTVFITVNLKAFLPFVFFQLPKLNIKTCRVVPEPLRPPGSLHYYKYLQIVVCVVYTATINPSGGFLLSPCEGCLLSICPISPSGKLPQSVRGMLLLSAATLCMLNCSSWSRSRYTTNIDGDGGTSFHFMYF